MRAFARITPERRTIPSAPGASYCATTPSGAVSRLKAAANSALV